MSIPSLDITRLTPAERLCLIEELWESLSAKPDQVPLTPAQEAELDRRIEEVENNGVQGIPLEQVIQRIRDRRG